MKQYTIATRTIVSGNTKEEALDKFAKLSIWDDTNNVEMVEGVNWKFKLEEIK